MNRHLVAVALLVAAGSIAGCSSAPKEPEPDSPAPSVPVEAAKDDLSILVGRWTGDYNSQDMGRSGSIVFELKSGGTTTANGDVLMWPKGSHEPANPPAGEQLSEEQLRKMPQVIEINFVRAQGSQITGTMTPYMDPDCQCDVRTVFVGTIQGDTIQGTFTTERWDTPEKLGSGVWKVTRQKADAPR
jgi:hypothetical protein